MVYFCLSSMQDLFTLLIRENRIGFYSSRVLQFVSLMEQFKILTLSFFVSCKSLTSFIFIKSLKKIKFNLAI